VAAINSNTALPVVARSVNGALVMDARASGASGAFTVAGKVITGELSSVAGVNSLFSVNGVAYESASRADSAAIPGVELSLASLTTAGTPARVTVSEAAVDKDAVVAKLKSFVEAYNAVVDTIRSKTTRSASRTPRRTRTPSAACCSATPACGRCCPRCGSG
jgi:flagellar capping protein FliD